MLAVCKWQLTTEPNLCITGRTQRPMHLIRGLQMAASDKTVSARLLHASLCRPACPHTPLCRLACLPAKHGGNSVGTSRRRQASHPQRSTGGLDVGPPVAAAAASTASSTAGNPRAQAVHVAGFNIHGAAAVERRDLHPPSSGTSSSSASTGSQRRLGNGAGAGCQLRTTAAHRQPLIGVRQCEGAVQLAWAG